MSIKRAVRGALDRLELSGLYYRLFEWRLSLKGEAAPPADASGLPIPPRYLITQVAGISDWRWFLESGERAAKGFAAYAAEAGTSFSSARRILDFGCGCGRIMRHLPKLTAAELHGVDYNPRLVKWCTRRLQGQFRVNRLHPPLPYPDGHFDIVYLMSVFTHLRIPTQREWLAELKRVTSPGGLVLLTFHDEHHRGLPDANVARQALARDGVYIHNNHIEGSNLIATFQTIESARRLFAEAFEVERIIPSNETVVDQALAVLRRASS